MTEILHARPPLLPVEFYMAVSSYAEAHPEAVLIVIRDPEACATVAAFVNDGVVHAWTVTSPMSEEGTHAFLADEVQRGNLAEDAVVYLQMNELTIN